MKKSKLIIIMAIAFCMNAFAADSLKTIYGTLTIDKGNVLFLNGKQYDPKIVGESILGIAANINLDENIAVLLINISGGNACPAQYRWLSLGKSGTTVTPEFGTCSDLAKPVKKGNKIIIKLPNYQFDSKAGSQSVYEYDGKTLTENGKVVK